MVFSMIILQSQGNMFSPIVLFILKEIMRNGCINDGDWGIVTAFGAGLSIHTLLFH